MPQETPEQRDATAEKVSSISSTHLLNWGKKRNTAKKEEIEKEKKSVDNQNDSINHMVEYDISIDIRTMQKKNQDNSIKDIQEGISKAIKKSSLSLADQTILKQEKTKKKILKNEIRQARKVTIFPTKKQIIALLPKIEQPLQKKKSSEIKPMIR